MTAAISVENLGKAYRLGVKEETPDTLAGALNGMLRAPFKNWKQLARLNTFRHQGEADDLFWALKDVSFEVPEGEVLGVIGRNGAGKSTLLKILSRITEPTHGRAVIRGRVSSLLEVGTGFHPELSGRDNIYMNGTILGMSKREIDRKFDEIVDFSGVEKFLDTPIKRYSSGMKVRLAFSVAAHLEPEILIIDEVLAVGDAEFQKKCLGKMQDVARGGRTIVFVSHNNWHVRSLCSVALILESGRVSYAGTVPDALRHYSEGLKAAAVSSMDDVVIREDDLRPRIGAVRLTDAEGHFRDTVAVGQPSTIVIDVVNPPPRMTVAFTLYDSIGAPIAHLRSEPITIGRSLGNTPNSVSCLIPELPLAPGLFAVNVALLADDSRVDHRECALAFEVTRANWRGMNVTTKIGAAPFVIPHSWDWKPVPTDSREAV